jgi:hypothetical protein
MAGHLQLNQGVLARRSLWRATFSSIKVFLPADLYGGPPSARSRCSCPPIFMAGHLQLDPQVFLPADLCGGPPSAQSRCSCPPIFMAGHLQLDPGVLARRSLWRATFSSIKVFLPADLCGGPPSAQILHFFRPQTQLVTKWLPPWYKNGGLNTYR